MAVEMCHASRVCAYEAIVLLCRLVFPFFPCPITVVYSRGTPLAAKSRCSEDTVLEHGWILQHMVCKPVGICGGFIRMDDQARNVR
jgi:hypothetical protein